MTLTCSAVSALDEPLAGTAGDAARWLCVEHPGPWGRDVLEAEVFGARTAAVAQWATAAGAKLLCVRRPGSSHGAPKGQHVIFAVTEPDLDRCRARELEFADLEELLALDPQEAFADRDGAWGARPVLVCAHGRRDQCCAVKGRPVAEALASAGQDVWECSHTGGHRFAPSVILLPSGCVYGRQSPEAAVSAAEAAAHGRIELEGLRGRTCWTAREQVAELALREQHRESVTRLCAREREDGDVDVTATFRTGDERRYRVSLQSEKLPPRPASCGAEPKSVVALRCVSLNEA